MSSLEPLPTVRVVLKRGTYSWMWIVPRCPFCGNQHVHVGGPLDSEPYAQLRCRVFALCEGIDPRYVLPDQPTPDIALPAYILEAERPG